MFELVSDLWRFVRMRKKFWLAPVLFLVFALGTLLVLAQGSAIAPFVYTLF